MAFDDLVKPFPWHAFSRKACARIENAPSAGFLSAREGMRLLTVNEGTSGEGNALALHFLIDESDGVVVDAKFHAFGQAALIAAAEAVCALSVGKNYDQVGRIGAELIDRHLADREGVQALPEEAFFHINFALAALDQIVALCQGIPLADGYVSPVPKEIEGEGYPGWLELSQEKKLAVIEQVLADDVRPYIELDEGGIEILELIEDKELVISYKGACTTCFSAIGATLSTIQQIVQAKVHPELKVVPNMDELQLH